MKPVRHLAVGLILSLSLSTIGTAFAQQENASPLGNAVLPPIMEGLKAAKEEMIEEEYDQCFFAGIFMSGFFRDVNIRDTGQSLAEKIDGFTCELSKPVFSNIYYVLGTITVSGTVHHYEVHIDEQKSLFGDGKVWSFAYLEIDRRELYRREGFEPLLIGRD